MYAVVFAPAERWWFTRELSTSTQQHGMVAGCATVEEEEEEGSRWKDTGVATRTVFHVDSNPGLSFPTVASAHVDSLHAAVAVLAGVGAVVLTVTVCSRGQPAATVISMDEASRLI